jgi:MOSC domain-containing protein YiiM
LAEVVAVARRLQHQVTKDVVPSIVLIAGQGVEGDAHLGELVKHRSRAESNPMLPNLRQVHLIHVELFAELAGKGFVIGPGQMGENVTTGKIDLLALPTRTRLHLGDEAVVELTGLRNPCIQLEQMMPGLMKAVLDRDIEGRLVRKAGVMAVVLTGGTVRTGDRIKVELPDGPPIPLEPV